MKRTFAVLAPASARRHNLITQAREWTAGLTNTNELFDFELAERIVQILGREVPEDVNRAVGTLLFIGRSMAEDIIGPIGSADWFESLAKLVNDIAGLGPPPQQIN
jgi:hypothetical protein